MEAIIGLLMIAAGVILHLFQKGQNAKALLDNRDINQKIDDLEKGIIKNDALLVVEEEKRKQVLAEVDDMMKRGKTDEEISKFYSDLPSSKRDDE